MKIISKISQSCYSYIDFSYRGKTFSVYNFHDNNLWWLLVYLVQLETQTWAPNIIVMLENHVWKLNEKSSIRKRVVSRYFNEVYQPFIS